MRGPSAGTVRLLLLSDPHFKHHDSDRVRQIANSIVAEATKSQVKQEAVCGDLLTSRPAQSTHVLSVSYRFISSLGDVVPRVHIVLSNHGLAYCRDYHAAALDALKMKRLAPYALLHGVTAHHGWMGSDPFVRLARSNTGHFSSHQTTTQKQSRSDKIDAPGSVAYMASLLQLSWIDLHDEQRGVILFDPETLEHEHHINPHAVGCTRADLQQVFHGHANKGDVADRHAMLIPKPTQFGYVTANDKPLKLGVRSTRKWIPGTLGLSAGGRLFSSLGGSVPASDAAESPLEKLDDSHKTGLTVTTNRAWGPGPGPGAGPENKGVDFVREARRYVESLNLDHSLYARRDELVRVGQRIIQASREITDQDDEANVNHEGFLDKSFQAVGTRTATEMAGISSTYVFVAEPRKLTITNFLGVENTLTIDFREDIPRGLTFLLGENGAGKSTILEAMTWCQFGKCIRGGLMVDDVVNDNVGKDCSVTLEFANGYEITRYRKHKAYKNRVIISRHGEPQPQFEHPSTRPEIQAAIDELLGTDYETYKMTVVLSHESAASVLNAKQAQRQDAAEAALGLSRLDQFGQLAKLLLGDIDRHVIKLEGKLDSVAQRIKYSEGRFKVLQKKQKELEHEAEKAIGSLEAATQDDAGTGAQPPDLEKGFRAGISKLKDKIEIEEGELQRLKMSHDLMDERMQEQTHAEPTSWLGRLQQNLLRKSGNPRPGSGGTSKAPNQDLRRDMQKSRLRLQTLKDQKRRAIDRAVTVSELAQSTIRAHKAQNEAAMYKGLAETEKLSLHSLRAEQDALATKRRQLAADRELILFWASAMEKLTRGASSSSSKNKVTATFREHMLRNSQSELKALVVQAVTVLYDDTRHMQDMATGMLRSLFDPQESESTDITPVFTGGGRRGRVLDATFPGLSYYKLSSGERKRVDLALFFALLQLARARSAHRAHYVLVDEAFDNLDEAGQTAVVKWCDVMKQAGEVGWIIVITHSRLLAERERDMGGKGGKGLVVEVKMGEKGTELVVGGRRIGGG